MNKKRIGIFGLGYLGGIHLKCLRQTPFEIVGFYDPDLKVQEKYGKELKCYKDPDKLIDSVDALDIVSSTSTHSEIILKALAKGKHVFVEKPICSNLEELQAIKNVRTDQIIQVGHVERFNPAFLQLKNKLVDPLFVEGHRIANFNPRGSDVSVVLDLMIHDLDILCALVPYKAIETRASGVSIISGSPDIANARIEFENGCVANLTASRISLKQMRKFRIFAQDAYISLDFLEKNLSIVKLEDADGEEDNLFIETATGKKRIVMEQPQMELNNAIADELNAFYQSIESGAPVEVGLDEAERALNLAWEINEKIEIRERKFFA